MPSSATTDAVIAYHEAAHAVAAEATGYGEAQDVRFSSEVGLHGNCRMRSLNYEVERLLVGDSEGEAYLLAHLLTTVAGFAANKIRGDETESWDEEVAFDEDGFDHPVSNSWIRQNMSDYEEARVLAHVLGRTIEHVMAETMDFLRQPDVWSAVERVAEALLQSDEGRLERDEIVSAIGDGLARYRITSLTIAMKVVRRVRRRRPFV